VPAHESSPFGIRSGVRALSMQHGSIVFGLLSNRVDRHIYKYIYIYREREIEVAGKSTRVPYLRLRERSLRKGSCVSWGTVLHCERRNCTKRRMAPNTLLQLMYPLVSYVFSDV
jgi:hypothetical protein